MLIYDGMRLTDLAEKMGEQVTIDDAESMRSILLFEGWEGSVTWDVPQSAWDRMVASAQDHSDEPGLDER